MRFLLAHRLFVPFGNVSDKQISDVKVEKCSNSLGDGFVEVAVGVVGVLEDLQDGGQGQVAFACFPAVEGRT